MISLYYTHGVVAEEDATRLELPILEGEIKVESKQSAANISSEERQSLESFGCTRFCPDR